MSVTLSPGRPSKHHTIRLRGQVSSSEDTTDYELSASVALPPPIHLNDEADSRSHAVVSPLGPVATLLFQQRLRLCCIIASAPITFYLICASTNFIELLGRGTVGWTGLALSGVTLTGLIAAITFLFLRQGLEVGVLRVLEVGIFGVLAIFFGYWQFLVQTTNPATGYEGDRHLSISILAASLIVHFNWFVLIVFHGVLIPNTLSRGAGVAAALSIAALAIDVVAAMVHPETRMYAGVVFAVAGTLLAAGLGLSIFGTAKTAALRREVETAREAIRELGQYRLRRKLGAGGMGEVYLAEHRLLKRPCALKRIHPRYLNNPEQVRRFEREVQATARLRHPNTVEIYDYGRADDGTFYYVMEYLPGLSLEEMIGRMGPMHADRVVHIIRQICGALREAHKHGLVHRDIKPSNVLVYPQGSPHDQAKLLDFGLVHSLTEEVDPESKITREGLIVGTPEYMSPEQASGGNLDGRSDLFSLGTVAYFLLTGREAFHRENPIKTLLAVVNDQPEPIAKYNPHVPDDVAAIIKKCLGKLPGDRYESAAELDHALAECSCIHHWTEARATEWWYNHPNALPGTGTDLDSLPLTDSQS